MQLKQLYGLLASLLITLCVLSRSDAQSSLIINSFDSVVFDIEQSTITGGYVEFPVSFLSDDTIYALDFSFKYNQVNFLYDSTLNNIIPGLTALAYYNPNDSIVRVTSYNLQMLPNDSPIVKLRFQVLNGTFCNSDMNTVKGYLNGDFCSYKIITCSPTGISEGEWSNSVEVYPNPVTNNLKVKAPAGSGISLLDVTGQVVYQSFSGVEAGVIDVTRFNSGLYFLQIEKDGHKLVRKLVFM